jgi:hypothetical protein
VANVPTKFFRKLGLAIVCLSLLGAGTIVATGTGGATSTGNAAQTEYNTGGQGCTPGYWKNHTGSWYGYSPTDSFDQVFGVKYFGSLTLLEAAGLGGGGFNALARHAVSALLNASNPNVSYGLTTTKIIELVQQAFKTNEPELIKDEFAALNEAGCPIDAHGNPSG